MTQLNTVPTPSSVAAAGRRHLLWRRGDGTVSAVVGPILLRTLWPAGRWKGVATVVLAVIVIQVPLLIMTAHVHSV